MKRSIFGMLFLVFGTLMAIGVYGIFKSHTPPSPVSNAVITTPNPAPVPVKPLKSRPNVSTAPVAPARPQVSFSVRKIGEQYYRVILPPGSWYDTELPMIANFTVVIHNNDDDLSHKFLTKLGGKEFTSEQEIFVGHTGSGLELSAEEIRRFGKQAIIVNADFKDTIKLKVDDAFREPLNLTIYLGFKIQEQLPLGNDPLHINQHQSAQEWFNLKMSKFERQ